MSLKFNFEINSLQFFEKFFLLYSSNQCTLLKDKVMLICLSLQTYAKPIFSRFLLIDWNMAINYLNHTSISL